MNKKQKINYIKFWLQSFGNRCANVFNIEIRYGRVYWDISIGYNYDKNGNAIKTYCYCSSGFEHNSKNSISDRTEEELDVIIMALNLKSNIY